MTAGWWYAPLALRDFVEAINITTFRVWKNYIEKDGGRGGEIKDFLKGGESEKEGDKYPLRTMTL